MVEQVSSIYKLLTLSTLLYKSLNAGNGTSLDKSVNVTLSLVRLRHEQVGDVATNVILIADSVSTKNFLKSTVQVSRNIKAVTDGWYSHSCVDQGSVAVLTFDH